ncbi:tyrosine-type recombinase/integrase [Methylobacterium sp. CM6257]
MATIRKRNSKFQVQVRLKGSPSLTRTFATKTEAVRWARDVEGGKINRNNASTAEQTRKVTFGDLLERYYKDILSHRYWYRTEYSILRRFSKSFIYNIDISELSEAEVARYRDDRLKIVKPATVVRELSIGSHCITVAQSEWGIRLPVNVFKMVRKPKIRNGRERRITDEEWNNLVQADLSRGRRSLIHIVEFAVETAMRKGELLRAKWVDVDFRQSTLHIPMTKNDYPRTIPLTPRAVEILKSIPKDGSRPEIFGVKYGTLSCWWTELLQAARVQDCRWHDLRHEGISRHFERGLSIPEVALISGHRDYQMLRRYTHIKPENVAAKLALLSNQSE